MPDCQMHSCLKSCGMQVCYHLHCNKIHIFSVSVLICQGWGQKLHLCTLALIRMASNISQTVCLCKEEKDREREQERKGVGDNVTFEAGIYVTFWKLKLYCKWEMTKNASVCILTIYNQAI